MMRNIFVGPNGIRAGWRLLIFIGIVAVELMVIGGIVRAVFPHATTAIQRPRVLTPLLSGSFEAITFVVVVIAALIMSRIESRPFATFGLPFRFVWQARFWRGAMWGFIAISIDLLVIFLLHGFRITGFATHGIAILIAVLAWLPAFLIVGLSEEFTFRGYAQYTLASGIGFWPAAVVLSAGFTAAHLGNSGESPMGLAQVFVFGMVFCFVLLRTGNLWWGVGFHAAWDWGETFFYGVPDSGLRAWHSLLSSSFSGAAWLTGGSVGPEGSVITPVVLVLTAVLIARAYPRDTYTLQPVSVRTFGSSVDDVEELHKAHDVEDLA